ncbi:hypothetical protein J8L97_14735 [Pseudoalteromonas sp. MMG012]|nr:hypothetical protein [Pseudoalteromonas sp. MMG012]MBQ4851389.1 hypothetical protein [Pseudoalteromonas sp. MMG012]
MKRYLFDRNLEHSSCGVGFITHKKSKQTHQLLEHAHQALCRIPHRGGMNAEGIGDGAGVNIDLSLNFFKKVTGNATLQLGEFGVANFFYPKELTHHNKATQLIEKTLSTYNLPIITFRTIATDETVLNHAANKHNDKSNKSFF